MPIIVSSPESVPTVPDPPRRWQDALRTAVRDPAELCRRLRLPAPIRRAATDAAESFGLFVPLEYLAKIRAGDPGDPLLRQVLPAAGELQPAAEFVADPVGDAAAAVRPGLLQKYAGRALIVTTGACAVHCRYCFRRHFPYARSAAVADRLRTVVEALRRDRTVCEVILSGGDPLMLEDRPLERLLRRLAGIPHVRRLRLHTRMPIVLSARVTPELLSILRSVPRPVITVVHANHPAEVDAAVGRGLTRLVDSGIPVLNQSVLLRGVNDDAETLIELSRRLIDLRVMPYYLHQLDRVAGAAHFEVPVRRGRQLIEQMRARLPGYAVPRYVVERPGSSHKQVLA